jgi:hypothetical protein
MPGISICNVKMFIRYGHTAVYAERYEVDELTNQNVLRKYMYIYGGFAYECIDACSDLWRYEIP